MKNLLCLWCLALSLPFSALLAEIFPQRVIGPHLRNKRTTEIWASGRFYAKLGMYLYGRERWLRANLTSGLSSCTQVFELA